MSDITEIEKAETRCEQAQDERDVLRAEVASANASLRYARAQIAELCSIDADLVPWGPGARYSRATIDEVQRRQVAGGLPPFSDDVIERVQQRKERPAVSDTRMLLEVYTASGIITVTTDRGDGGGTRLCGVKLHGSGSTKVCEFWLDRNAIDALVDDFASIEEAGCE